jgi:multidrug efflux pump subunit AcrB
VTAILVGWGVFVYLNAPRKEDPAFVIRDSGLITVWPGATAEQVEKLVTDPLEKAIENVAQVRRTQSSSYPGLSVIQITLKDAVVDAKIWWDKVRAEVDLARPQLPPGSLSPLLNDTLSQATVMNLSVFQDPKSEGRRYTPRELENYTKRLRDEIMDQRPMLPNEPDTPNPMAPAYVERVDIFGIQSEAIYIETEMGKWGQLAITPDQLGALLVQRNLVTPAGTIDTDRNKYFVQLSGQLSAVDEIENITVGRVSAAPGGAKERESLLALARLARTSAAQDRDKLGPVPLSLSQAAPVALKDLDLQVTRRYQDPPESLTRFTGKDFSAPCLVISLTMKPGVNIVLLDKAVDQVVAKAKATYLPPDIQVVRTSDQPAAVDQKIAEVSSNVVSSVVAVVVVLIFMSGLRLSFIAGMAVPMIMLITIGLMRIWNIELEQVSLSALIIALGILVDSTIQVCDNTQAHLNRGEPSFKAALKGTNEIAAPVLISALTVIASFLPMAFIIPGAAREALVSLPVVVSLSIAVGWMFAVTMTAILCAKIMKPSGGSNWLSTLLTKLSKKDPKATAASQDSADSGRPGLYQQLAILGMKFRWPVVIVAYLALAASPLLMPPMDFFPLAVRNQFVVELYLPAGTPMKRTDEVAKQVEQAIQRLNQRTFSGGKWEATGERLTNVSTFVGTGGPFNFLGLYPKTGGSNFAVLWVNTANPEVVPDFVSDLRRATDEGLGEPDSDDFLPPIIGARVVPQRLVTGEPILSTIDIRILGPRLARESVLRTAAEEVKRVLYDSGMAWNIHDGWGEHILQLDVDMDQERANLAGVTNATVALSLNAYYAGHPLTIYREEDRQIPVLLRLHSQQRASLDDLGTVYVQGFAGKLPLSSVADVRQSWHPSCIERYKRERNMAVRCRPETGLIYSQVLDEIKPRLDEIEAALPPGYRIEIGGTKELSDKGVGVIGTTMSVSMAIIFVLLVIQFNSIPKTAMILLTLPLAVPGGLFGLQMMGLTLGFTSLLGFVALAGIVLSAAILLMDFSARLVNERIEKGQGVSESGQKSCSGLTRESFRQAIADAGELRFMPIMMTTLTTIGGLLSLMFAGGPLFEGMATVMVVGLTFGTALTLFVLPAWIAVFVEDFGLNMVALPKATEISGNEREEGT